ncbi:helix-turn-helix domain-containing protein [Aneurinibacillus terranovensis]|uniref:helix-turn-helix domain-containing protein n=1 Tax=Aneurinibacillus terranovensis TaxID=278991 RepID=UPI000415C35B|nr:helix-turn-helix domain-containing protein [Aneurinibacillus terranovensis]
MDLLNEVFKLSDDIFSLGLDPTEFVIYCYLIKIFNDGNAKIFSTIRKIATVCNINKNTAEKKIKSLEEKGVIKIHKYKNKNYYELLPVTHILREKHLVLTHNVNARI